MSEIRVYPSLLREIGGVPAVPLETHVVDSGTLRDWLIANVPSYAENPKHNPWEVELDCARGDVVPAEQYGEVLLIDDDVVHLYINPQRSVARAVGSLFSAAVDLFSNVFSWLMPDIPTPGANGQIEQGSQISDPSVTVNRPRLNGVINQVAGQVKIAPYYLSPPRTYFINPRTKAVDILLCVGWGAYQVPAAQIRIAGTPVAAFGADVNFQVFQPGESIAGHSAHQLWYTAPEVGSSVGGNAGLQLKSTVPLTERLAVFVANVSGDTISVNAPDEIPADWISGTLLNVRMQRQVIANPPALGTTRAIFTGEFADLGLSVGDSIEISDSGIAGDYVVHTVSSTELTLSYPDLAPVAGPTSGTYQATVDRAGARYRILSNTGAAMVVEKLLADGTTDLSWAGWPPRTYHGFFNIRIDSSYSEGQWLGWFAAQKQGRRVVRIEADIFYPQGLGTRREDASGIDGRLLQGELQWREIGTETINSVPFEHWEATADQLGFMVGVDLPSPMEVECRVRRLTPEDTDMRVLDNAQWISLRSLIESYPVSYPEITVLALTIIGSDAVARSSENRITCVPTAILPTMEGPTQPTRAIADWIRNAANQSGISDDEIDMDALQRLHDILTARGDTFDFNHDSDDTVKAVLQRAHAAGFAQLTWDDVLVPVRDEPRTQLEQMYSPQNMRADALMSKSIRAIRPDDYDGVDVEYKSAITGTVETIECRLPGSTGERVETIRVEGVTDETRAWRHGMRRLMWHRYIRKNYSWGTPTDALNSNLGSYCPVVGAIPSYAQSAQIEQVVVNSEGVHLLCNEALNWEGIEQHVIYWRKPDGSSAGPYNVARGEDDYHVIAAMGSDPVPEVDPTKEPPHLLFGQIERVIVKSINPSGMSAVSVEAEGYDERLYQFDDAVPG